MISTVGTLNIAEKFFSVQGECVTSGKPSVFIRLKDCNLACGLSVGDLQKIKAAGCGGFTGGMYRGELQEVGEASWTCDSAPVWLFGEKLSFAQLYNWLADYKVGPKGDERLLDWVACKRAHIIWTGGEPTMKHNMESIVGFSYYLRDAYMNEVMARRDTDAPDALNVYTPASYSGNPSMGTKVGFHEIETNGTQVITPELVQLIDQFNVSAKLSNSGMPAHRRIVPLACKAIIHSGKSYHFKFVVSTEDDIKEALRDYVDNPEIKVPINRVVIMPGLDDRADFFERTQFVMEAAIKYGVIGLTRNHIAAWDKATGV